MFVGAGSFFNPIPTGNGLIIYSYHVTPAGRNRIKPNISALSGLLLTALPEWPIFLLKLSGHSSLYLPCSKVATQYCFGLKLWALTTPTFLSSWGRFWLWQRSLDEFKSRYMFMKFHYLMHLKVSEAYVRIQNNHNRIQTFIQNCIRKFPYTTYAPKRTSVISILCIGWNFQ